jgi:hypothetical protein
MSMVQSVRVMILFFMNFPRLSQREKEVQKYNFETRNPKFETISNGQKPESSKQAFKTRKLLANRLGYGNGDRTWYPTLFGWEIGKRLAYFTLAHELSSALPRFRVPSLGLTLNSKR